jgi:cystathionine beta-lyase/cystathionine gamma-synthase
VPTEKVEAVREALRSRPATRMLFIESPANPTLKLTDLEACGRRSAMPPPWRDGFPGTRL